LGAADSLRREARQLEKALGNVQLGLEALGIGEVAAPAESVKISRSEVAKFSRLGWTVYRSAERLRALRSRLEAERAAILKYRAFYEAFRPVIESEERWPNAVAYHVLFREPGTEAAAALRSALEQALGGGFELYEFSLPQGERGAVIVTLRGAAPQVERVLAQSGIEDLGVPPGYRGESLAEAMPRMLSRLEQIPKEMESLTRRFEELVRQRGPELLRAKFLLRERLELVKAAAMAGATDHGFVFEGWVPASAVRVLRWRLRERVGVEIVVYDVSREQWASDEPPVVLRNPRIFRPFESIVALLPLPKYGSVDPTPFVAVFFPAFFGLIVGDIGYGAILAIGGLLLHRKSKPNTALRNIAEIIGPCALFSIGGGLLYGELFGDLGRRWFGLQPLLFSREEALVTFLLLALALGAVHVLLGLFLGMVGAGGGHRRRAVGRGAAAVTIVLIIVSLLAAGGVLPEGFFTPGVVGILLAFPVLVLVEGLMAPLELLSTLGNILSYARIMAVGVASLMLAVVANRMAGAVGSVVVGVLFGLLFHLVNFALAVLSPAVHALRLHYVEFFGKFYSPGGVPYRPLGRGGSAGMKNQPVTQT
jgi:V/A-type H+-transporting ATPase subunit I